MLFLGLLAIGVLVYGYWEQQSELILVLRQVEPVDEVAIAEARNDILRTTLTATAGFAAAAVLLLNFQKQRHEEYNATQQRIAELRIQAVQQLGSESPSVRIGGLHNLERLGEAHPELRQIVLDEICSYLRLDYVPGKEGEPQADREEGGPDSGRGRSAESEVRLIAQEMLQRHLKFATAGQRRGYWSHERLNLKNARLEDLDLCDCRLENARFEGARFTGRAEFKDAQFSGNAWFGDARFAGGAFFGAVRFAGDAKFGRARFAKNAWFGSAQFSGETRFANAQITGDAWFGSARFVGGTHFWDAQFLGEAWFRDARFAGDAYFEGARFNKGTDFGDAQFSGDAKFGSARFAWDARFRDARFAGDADFGDGRFAEGAYFLGAGFARGASFRDAQFTGDADFGGIVFSKRQEAESLPVGWCHPDLAEDDGTWRLVRSPQPEPSAEVPDSSDTSTA